jgi:putative glutamine amidotransferase
LREALQYRPAVTRLPVSNLASWIRPRDEKWFEPILATRPGIKVCNAARHSVNLDEMKGLLLTGGSDISREYLGQPVPDPSVLEKGDLRRDQWEFAAVQKALERGLPILAICKGMQLLNVALGGTLRLDIRGHNLPAQKSRDVQPLRNDASAAHRFAKVNSSHHQAIDRLADGCVVESWCTSDEVIEQFRLRDFPFGLAVQYHPERGSIYGPLFRDFLDRIE